MVRVVDVHAHALVTEVRPLVDLDTRLAAMDAAGVDVQAVSVVPAQHPARAGRRLAAELVDVLNDGVAALVRRAPDRLVGIATVALHHPELAAEQLRCAVDDYDFRGVQISSTAGRDLSHPALDPFWSIAAALGVVVFVHPPGCPPGPFVDTAPAVSHPVSGDVLDRFPDLTVCVAQGNGYAVLRRPDTVGPDRVLWGSGYPFATDASRPRDIVESLSPAEFEAVSGGAARALLRLNGPAPWDDPGKESTVQEQETVSGGREVALVTGANKGIGFHVARQLGQAGRRVWLGSRSRERGEKAADQLRTEGVDVDLVLLDVTDDASVAAAQELVAREAGRLDILVNNAGVVAGDAAPSESQVDDVRRTYETNVFGVIAVTNAFLPLLRRSPRGRVVNVSSELGSIGGMADPEWEWAFLHLLAYQSSKAAQNAVTLLYAKELRDAGITVNAVNPGIRATDMNTGDQSSLGDPADGAAIITKIALAGPDGPTGQFYEEDGSLYPW